MSTVHNPEVPPFIELQQVDSTNNYATALLHAGMTQHGTAVFAHEQIKGRGQRNKEWISDKDQNIALSIIFNLKGLATSQMFLLSMAVAVSVRQFLNEYTDGSIKIKWPNDLYWRDRKAAGILIENIIQGNYWKYAIVGIGVNVNQVEFNDLQNKAVSLRQITGKKYEPLLLAKELAEDIRIFFNDLIPKSNDIITQYRNGIYKLNESVRLKKGNRQFNAIIKDVTTLGQLVVTHGMEEQFEIGEVEWII